MGASKEESRRIFDLFVEAGGNFIDTANNYTNGTSERYVGEFAKSDRDRYVIATSTHSRKTRMIPTQVAITGRTWYKRWKRA